MRTAPPNAALDRRIAIRNPLSPARARSAGSATADLSRTKVWERYRDNAARHLIGIARDFQNRALRHLAEDCAYADLRPSLGPLLSLVAIEQRPLGTLATQLSISPQACSQLVNLGESAGYLERRSHSEDRRTRLVGLTDRGRSLVADAIEILRSVESDYRDLVGATAYTRFTQALVELFRGLGLPAHSDVDLAAKSTGTLGVLPLISVRIQQDLMEATAARGYAGLKMSHAQVLPLIGSEGARVHELARIQRVSRQAISATARDLEGLGHLARAADPRDRRGVVYRLTAKGECLIQASVAALDELDETFLGLLGARRLRGLESVARQLYQALHLEEEIFEARASLISNSTEDAHVRRRASPRSDDASPRKAGAELERLAAKLRRELGARDAGRLAALLDSRI